MYYYLIKGRCGLFTTNGNCDVTTEQGGKAMQAVSGRDTANATSERA